MPHSELLVPEGAKPCASRTKDGRFSQTDLPPKLKLAVTVRPQTPEEGRRFGAALDLFLSELVRQQLHRAGMNNHEV